MSSNAFAASSVGFGAQSLGDEVLFRLWAPAAERVDVVLERNGQGNALAMHRVGEGWFELRTAEASVGSTYRYLIDGEMLVPDPASRSQTGDVHGPSAVVDPASFAWSNSDWKGRPWNETILYELHVGTFSPEGTFDGVRARLDHLVALGVTAIELMPVADFPGKRGWGYDGVLPYAPERSYGTPDDLKRLIDEAHGRGLMVFLDVVYNHFGPDGNYLHRYAPQFFTDRFSTPWGDAIDFSRNEVRGFFIQNALYWLEEFRFDGLRFDAVHAIADESESHFLDELAATVRERTIDRHIHLVLENDDNASRYLRRDGRSPGYDAQWNDDIHHAFHVVATGESDAYYQDYAADPVGSLARCLTEGFAYQGEPSPFRDGERRGSRSADLPPTAFVAFDQNHDQVGNRALGERLDALVEPSVMRALAAILLLAPNPPMLFMGQEWGAAEPFLYFCDFHDELADAVRDGRRSEFSQFAAFHDEAKRRSIPDPNDPETFQRSKLNWDALAEEDRRATLAFHSELIALRQREIVPRLAGLERNTASARRVGDRGLIVSWTLADNARLHLAANLSSAPLELGDSPAGRVLYRTPNARPETGAPWSVAWFLE